MRATCQVRWKGNHCSNPATHRAVSTDGTAVVFHVCEDDARIGSRLTYHEDHHAGMLAGDPLWLIFPPLEAGGASYARQGAMKTEQELRDKLDEMLAIDCAKIDPHMPNGAMMERAVEKLVFAKVASCKVLLWALGENDDDRWHIRGVPGPPIRTGKLTV